MIKTLREKHLQIWSALAIALPLGIIFSWLVIPNSAPVKIIETGRPALLPVIQTKKETLSYCIIIRTNEVKTKWQLEWKNKLALTVPSAVVYKVSRNLPGGGTFGSFKQEDAQLIGRIEARGDYVFELKPDSAQERELNIIVYDFIHNKVVDSITLKIRL